MFDGITPLRRRFPPEFLGTRAEFDRIDTDRDGLISPEEAIRFDALVRKGK